MVLGLPWLGHALSGCTAALRPVCQNLRRWRDIKVEMQHIFILERGRGYTHWSENWSMPSLHYLFIRFTRWSSPQHYFDRRSFIGAKMMLVPRGMDPIPLKETRAGTIISIILSLASMGALSVCLCEPLNTCACPDANLISTTSSECQRLV